MLTDTGSGVGTDVCGRCGGPKEPTRHRSKQCRKCDAERKEASAAKADAAPVSGNPKYTVAERFSAQAKAITALRRSVAALEARVAALEELTQT